MPRVRAPADEARARRHTSPGKEQALNAIILAAGRGTRLGPLGRSTPKVLVEVDGEPLLARQIRYLTAGGVRNIVINAHHLADQIERFVAGHPQAAHIEVVLEPKLLGTAGGVRNALTQLGQHPFVVLYGDVLCDEPIDEVWESHMCTGAAATITVYESEEIDGKGIVDILPDRSVEAFHEKPGATGSDWAYVNAGLYVVDPRLVASLPSGVQLDFGGDVFPAALARGERIVAHILPAPVIDVGTPAALRRARQCTGRSLSRRLLAHAL